MLHLGECQQLGNQLFPLCLNIFNIFAFERCISLTSVNIFFSMAMVLCEMTC